MPLMQWISKQGIGVQLNSGGDHNKVVDSNIKGYYKTVVEIITDEVGCVDDRLTELYRHKRELHNFSTAINHVLSEKNSNREMDNVLLGMVVEVTTILDKQIDDVSAYRTDLVDKLTGIKKN